MNPVQNELRRRLCALGFDAVKFASVHALPGQRLRVWLAEGFHADMHWMERTAEKRLNPELVLEGVKSAILFGVNYWAGAAPAAKTTEVPTRPLWARYALYQDYHDTIKPALAAAGKILEEIYGVTGEDYRYYVDTGPVLERGWASEAGLGFIGKNGMLISRNFGNWLFLATIFTRVKFAPDEPLAALRSASARPRPAPANDVGLLCGKCTRCLDACPTAAFPQPGVIDARRCISYQTIENKGIIPRELRKKIGLRIYGCDLCAEVCPWNRFAQEGRRLILSARDDLAELSLKEILEFTPERFADVFRKTPIKRIKLAGLLRNACIVAANTPAPECLDAIVRLCSHDSSMVRAHAVWAVIELAGFERARELLASARQTEKDAAVMAEWGASAPHLASEGS